MNEKEKPNPLKSKAKPPPQQTPQQPPKQPDGEIGGAEGLEPTRYGDWEHGGRCTDF